MQLLNLFDYEEAARASMEPSYYAYYAGGVADNVTLRENRAAFDRLRLRPKMMRDVSHISLQTAVAGHTMPLPIMIAPAAMHKLAHPDGELATARAAAALGVTQVLSTMSTVAVEEVTAVGHPVWFQLYLFRDRDWSAHIVQRAEAAGCQALVLTVDVPAPGLRENLVRAGFATPNHFPFPNFVRPGHDLSVSELMSTVTANFDAALTWDDIGWLRRVTRMPIWVKGVLRGDDARRAVAAGAAGIVVSNHGGRQLDTAVAAIDALPEVVTAVGQQIDVIMDGGVRRGTDIIKALALGAKAVLLGRAPLWGLAVNGEDGARHVLALLRHELENGMAQCGCPTIADITPDLIFTSPR